MKRPLCFADWLAENPPPDLQKLAEHYGADGIPDKAWLDHIREVMNWHERLRERHRDV